MIAKKFAVVFDTGEQSVWITPSLTELLSALQDKEDHILCIVKVPDVKETS